MTTNMTKKKKIKKIEPWYRHASKDGKDLWGFASKEDLQNTINKINEIIEYLNDNKH